MQPTAIARANVYSLNLRKRGQQLQTMTSPDYAAMSSPFSGGKHEGKFNIATAYTVMMPPPAGMHQLLGQETTQTRRSQRRSKPH